MMVAMAQRSVLVWRYVLTACRRPFIDLGSPSMVYIIFVGTFIVTIFLTGLLLYSHHVFGDVHDPVLFVLSAISLMYLVVAGGMVSRHLNTVAAWLLIVFYGCIAVFTMVMWGINVAAGVLMLAFTIILAGVMLGARYIIPVTIGATAILASVQAVTMFGLIHPATAHLSSKPNFGNVACYGTIFIIFAVVMWISQLRLEQALYRTLQAERALEKQRASLAVRLKEETRLLKDSQFEEMRQLYRFSELGRSSVTLLHELANHLAVITLDIDAIEQRRQPSDDLVHLKQSINYIDRKIRQVRHQLKESAVPQRMAIEPLMNKLVDHLRHRCAAANVLVKLKIVGKVRYIRGDPQKLFQAMTILVTNAVEASVDSLPPRTVLIIVDQQASPIKILVTDHGVGISSSQRRRLFKPFTSTKKDGMGIGLFIAQQIIHIHMNGTLELDPRKDETTFIVTLPEDE